MSITLKEYDYRIKLLEEAIQIVDSFIEKHLDKNDKEKMSDVSLEYKKMFVNLIEAKEQQKKSYERLDNAVSLLREYEQLESTKKGSKALKKAQKQYGICKEKYEKMIRNAEVSIAYSNDEYNSQSEIFNRETEKVNDLIHTVLSRLFDLCPYFYESKVLDEIIKNNSCLISDYNYEYFDIFDRIKKDIILVRDEIAFLLKDTKNNRKVLIQTNFVTEMIEKIFNAREDITSKDARINLLYALQKEVDEMFNSDKYRQLVKDVYISTVDYNSSLDLYFELMREYMGSAAEVDSYSEYTSNLGKKSKEDKFEKIKKLFARDVLIRDEKEKKFKEAGALKQKKKQIVVENIISLFLEISNNCPVTQNGPIESIVNEENISKMLGDNIRVDYVQIIDKLLMTISYRTGQEISKLREDIKNRKVELFEYVSELSSSDVGYDVTSFVLDYLNDEPIPLDELKNKGLRKIRGYQIQNN